MTPEHEFTLWTTALTAFPTIALTGALAYWTWLRDQERIIVQKSPVYLETLDGAQTNATLAGVGIVVRNLSLFPVRIAGLGFQMGRQRPFAFDRNQHKEEWPLEIASRARMIVFANPEELKQLQALGLPSKVMDWKLVAIAITETGSPFRSNRLSVGIMRPVRALRRWFIK
jgi:hypothetical protein